jgi:hypothetical protein
VADLGLFAHDLTFKLIPDAMNGYSWAIPTTLARRPISAAAA